MRSASTVPVDSLRVSSLEAAGACSSLGEEPFISQHIWSILGTTTEQMSQAAQTHRRHWRICHRSGEIGAGTREGELSSIRRKQMLSCLSHMRLNIIRYEKRMSPHQAICPCLPTLVLPGLRALTCPPTHPGHEPSSLRMGKDSNSRN